MRVSAVAAALLLLASPSLRAEDSAGIEFFEKKIRPVLAKHCYSCHSPEAKSVKGGLRVDHRSAMLEGGESGEAVVPGEPDESLLISSLKYESFEMPPTGQLPEAVIADFEKWVEMGAPAPDSKPTAESKESGYSAAANDDLWSLRPVEVANVPAVEKTDWPRTDVDRFVLAELEAAGLAPVGDASRETLLRRLCFDLTGLPPTPEQRRAFLADDSPDAVARLVDELLASPAYGERWGRHWLDVARYAESNGKSRDVLMPDAWRYRNWVVDAFNADLPFDEFVTQQLAGDLLPADSPEQRDRQLVATGLLAVGSKPLVGGNLPLDLADDQIDVVSKAFLGLTVSCARCHDHKFDPIPTADYYALAGIFLSTDTRYGGGLRGAKNQQGKAQTLLVLGENADERLKVIAERVKLGAAATKRLAAEKKKLQQLRKKKADEAKITEVETKIASLEEEIAALKKAQRDEPLEFACGVVDGDKPSDCRIRIRGEKNKQGDSVPRGFLTSIDVEVPEIPQDASGRLELAAFVTHPDNPLTPRVAVNRLWHHLFGRGLVETVDNFGNTGTKPSHPELLDYLAGRLVQNEWSLKRTIREIVLSRTYQLAGTLDESNYERDPANTLLWRSSRRRLEAEALRDAMLAASGELVLERPETSVVARMGDGEVGRTINLKPLSEPFPHRSVYLPIIRGIVPEFLKTFDFPEPSNVLGRRSTTNVPMQSLFLMNSPFVVARAERLATLAAKTGDDDTAVATAYERALGRLPRDDERSRAVEFLSRHAAQLDGENPRREALVSLCQALFASAEFRFVE